MKTTYNQALKTILKFHPEKTEQKVRERIDELKPDESVRKMLGNRGSDFTEVLPMFGLSEFSMKFYEIALKGVYELEQADMTFGEYVTIMDAVIKEIKDRQDMAREIIKSGEK